MHPNSERVWTQFEGRMGKKTPLLTGGETSPLGRGIPALVDQSPARAI
jgi:hypothetical protein